MLHVGRLVVHVPCGFKRLTIHAGSLGVIFLYRELFLWFPLQQIESTLVIIISFVNISVVIVIVSSLPSSSLSKPCNCALCVFLRLLTQRPALWCVRAVASCEGPYAPVGKVARQFHYLIEHKMRKITQTNVSPFLKRSPLACLRIAHLHDAPSPACSPLRIP